MEKEGKGKGKRGIKDPHYDPNWELKLNEKEKAILKKVRSRAKLYDTGIDLGFTKVGIDPIIGLVPAVGDLVTSALALQLVFSCAEAGIDRNAVRKMYLNVIIDFSLGFIPIVGDLGDFVFKCNDRNMKKFEEELEFNMRSRAAPAPKVPDSKDSALKVIVEKAAALKGKMPAIPGLTASKSTGPGKKTLN